MCGEFDDNERIDEELFDRFLELALHFKVQPDSDSVSSPADLQSEDARSKYMDELFRAGLKRCMNDAANLPLGERMDALAGQAIVFARLVGFLTAQFPPEVDLYRTVTAAIQDGYNEPAHIA
ncbi:MAG: hypothetical protein HKN77_06650 [Woeseiaceae bacterium]|nr:hypothetical protein [Woeseiaceae bacterium]